jgi:hypothetical protein
MGFCAPVLLKQIRIGLWSRARLLELAATIARGDQPIRQVGAHPYPDRSGFSDAQAPRPIPVVPSSIIVDRETGK